MQAGSSGEDIAQLLLERQAKGLCVPAVARMIFSLYGLSMAFTIDSVSHGALLRVGSLNVIGFVLNSWFLYLLRQRRHVNLVGWIGVLYDSLVIALYPMILQALIVQHGVHWIHGAKGAYALVYISFICINALALQPKYPAAVGIAAIATYVGMIVVASSDPAVTWSNRHDQIIAGPAVGVGQIIGHAVFIAIVTAALVLITRSARRTILEAVQRQAERARLVREHAASVMEGRLDALRNLVASLSHEMNTPVGAVRSASSTISSAVDRLAERSGGEEGTKRLMKLISDTARIPADACARLESMLQRLTAFSHLDASETQLVDVNEALDRTVALVPAEVVGECDVVRDYGASSRVSVAPGRLNLALMTIVTNAFEANRGKGQVRLETAERPPSVVIAIADDGPGLSEADAGQIFEFRIDEAATRVKAGLGLPAAYSLIKTHGGDIAVGSGAHRGARFEITLPSATPAG